MIFCRINSLFFHNILHKSKYEVLIIKDSMQITSPYTAVFCHICIGSSIFKSNHWNCFPKIFCCSHMNLITLYG